MSNPDESTDDSMIDLLCTALDTATADPRRLQPITALCLLNLDPDRETALDRLQEGGFQVGT